mmetsp:Transcript_8059/g.33261  ORF Transcript_8059/g.33261 Transcript_8059/m.33261 type:complete len:190 (+) Transcript_8059:1424-1993(+)
MGADELLAGYARHRTAFRRGGRTALARELDYDVARIATRNLGRDDRAVSDAGREARYPFLDEEVVRVARGELRLEEVADLAQPPGVGDKRVLRDVARLLGLATCARLQKRAIQFGTRIAKHSNLHAFGATRRGDGTAAFAPEILFEAAARGALFEHHGGLREEDRRPQRSDEHKAPVVASAVPATTTGT